MTQVEAKPPLNSAAVRVDGCSRHQLSFLHDLVGRMRVGAPWWLVAAQSTRFYFKSK